MRKSINQLIRLLSYLRGHAVHFLIGLFLIILMSYTNSIVPVLIRNAIDKGVSTGAYKVAIRYGLLILLVGVLNGVFSLAGRYLLVKAAQYAVYYLRMDAFRAIQRHEMEFFDKTFSGQLISRITNDTERITRFLSFRVRMLLYSIFLIIISLYYMVRMNITLTMVALITIAIVVGLNTTYAMKVRPIYDKIRHQTGVIASIATGTIAGIKTIKSLSVEENVQTKFSQENEELYSLNVKAMKITALYGNAPFLVLGLAMSTMFYYGGKAIIQNTLTVGELVAFLTYMLTMMWPLRALGFTIGDIQRSLAAASRLFDVIDSAPKSIDPPDAVEISNPRGEIEFRDVWLTYHTGRTVLKGVSFKVKPGEKVLITGPPGSGKSSILKLIARFYKPTKGEVLIDGVNVAKIKTENLRKIVAYVPQEPFIFNRSIRENIALAKPNATQEEVERAAKIAKIHDFIASLPKGYDTVVGEKGITLSGGQRQRIALARAMLMNPKIVLLDDPVSNLDAETEKKLVEDLKEILQDKTALIVSQRLSLVKLVDRVIVMKDGKIVEDGKPEELIKKGGIFSEMMKAGGVYGG
ncbi:ABC transporter ATP-binding protein [Pyrococcus abyssi]|uniref:ABC transporter, ATP-binding protein n=1 Tax=Pyrococcus abyssi (strain GE5 / Orsay) TaxID=272844 RepID=Q9V1X6_PYRAB|nr:ABC transporter ATP-binding protein [Pyrococcus abyssi]CAB49222.1 ABC-type transport system, ATPase component, substrate unknown [Pyrococcus abyssi GE5]CCE69676.1 TPA: ABC transporter, ATP-binding protein [Pyrococcus abyssi GE5]